MLKNFSLRKDQATLLVTIVVLIALGIVYFFVYVPANEKLVQERRFRCLRKIDQSVNTKINTAEKLISTLANDFNKDKSDTSAQGKKKPKGTQPFNDSSKYKSDAPEIKALRSYARQSSRKDFAVLLPDQASIYFSDKNNHHLISLGTDTSGNAFFAEASSQLTILVKRPSHKPKGEDIVIGVKYEYDQFISPLLLTDVFDNYVIFIGDRKVYEDYPSGLNVERSDSLLTVNNKVSSPGLRTITIAENTYKVFSQPMLTYTGSKWTVSGLLKDERYQKEKSELPLWIVLLLIMLAIAMLVSLPWIKLFHMGSKDQLTSSDGAGALIMAALLVALLFFALFKYRVDFITDRLTFNEHGQNSRQDTFAKTGFPREVLATEVANAFTGELGAANKLLDEFEAYHLKNLKQLKSDTDHHLLGKGKTPYDSLYKKYNAGLDVKQIFWLNRLGADVTNLTTDSVNDPKGHYQNRGYFKYAGIYTLGSDHFYLDQVNSYTTGEYRSVVSHKTGRSDSIIAATLTLKSLDHILLPAGYEFAVISDKGWVLYHTTANRQQIDRLQTELSNSDALVSGLKAHAEASFTSEYYGNWYTIKIKPVGDLPYFVVIFEDSSYNDTRDTEAYVFTFGMLAVLLIFLAINYSVIFFVSSRQLLFKGQRFDTSWIGPHVSAHRQYNIAIIINLFMIGLMVIFFNNTTFLGYLYILLVSVVWASLNLNVIFAKKYRDESNYKRRYKQKAIRWLIFVLLLINITAFFILHWTSIVELMVYQAFIFISVRLTSRWGEKLIDRIQKRLKNRWKLRRKYTQMSTVIKRISPKWIYRPGKNFLNWLRETKNNLERNWTYTYSYAAMATTRLIISSGIPVAFFFIYSFNYEQNLDTRYRQLTFAKTLSGKNFLTGAADTAKKNTTLTRIGNNAFYSEGVYFDGMFIKKITFNTKVPQIAARQREKEEKFTSQLLGVFRLKISDIVTNTADLDNSSLGGDVYFSHVYEENGDKSPLTTYYKTPTGYLAVHSMSGLSYHMPHPLFWVLLAALIFVFFFIFHIVIKKVFALTLHSDNGWKMMDAALMANSSLNRMAFVVGSPGASTLDKVFYYINSGKLKTLDDQPLLINNQGVSKKNVLIADMMLMPTESGESDDEWQKQKQQALKNCGLVIINHFEYNIYESASNARKLDLLELLIAGGNCKVIVISTVHPLVFLESVYGAGKNMFPQADRGRWHMLLGKFRVIIDPLVRSGKCDDVSMAKKAIFDETRFSRFLHQMQRPALRALKYQMDTMPAKELNESQIINSLIYKIQLTAQYFYMDIWQSLTWEEKFLLYDLAEDGLVNPTDDINLSMLICKGLVVNDDGALGLFNRSFRNFILTAIAQNEVEFIKKQLKDNSKWSNLKVPFSLAIVAILAFLFASRQETYQQIIAYATALGAGIPVVFKLFSLAGGNGKPAATAE